MNAESHNFDIGVKNYKKNRLIVNQIHLKNEILFNTEKTNKPNFTVSCVAYVNDKSNPRGFFNILKDLEVSNLNTSFNFFINAKGNVITNVEMSDTNFFYKDADNNSNIVICLNSNTLNEKNNSTASKLYTYNQINSLTKMLESFTFDTKSTTFKELDVRSDLLKITNVGFSIKDFLKQRGLG